MSTLIEIIRGKHQDIRYLSYQLLLYSYPSSCFYEKVAEMEKAYTVPVGEFLRDELWLMGLIEDRGKHRIGPRMRSKIKDFLVEHPLEIEREPVKNQKMKDRQIEGLKTLKKYGERNGYYILYYNEGRSLLMQELREKGILVLCGSSWAYVYKSKKYFTMNENFPLLGYFQLAGSNVTGKLQEAISGGMTKRTTALSERRKAFAMRQKARWQRVNEKRKAIKENKG